MEKGLFILAAKFYLLYYEVYIRQKDFFVTYYVIA